METEKKVSQKPARKMEKMGLLRCEKNERVWRVRVSRRDSLPSAGEGRDVHLVVNADVTRELGDSNFKGELGTEASWRVRKERR